MCKRLKYENPAAMQMKIDAYFAEQERRGKPATIMGLVRVLGFESRMSLVDYKERDDYSYIINGARRRVQESCEELLYGRDTFRGAQFVLRVNYGWVEPKSDADEQVRVVLVNDVPRSVDQGK